MGVMNLYRSISIAALAVVSAAPGFAQFPCSVELPVYDPEGQRLAFRVAKVWPVGVKKDGDVPRSVAGTYRVAASGTAIEFARNWLVSNGFWATLAGPGAAVLEIKVPLAICRYRQSTVYGNRDSGADAAYTVLSGRIVGCRLEGDWWARAVPMFGGGVPVVGFEGYVDRSTGEFTIAGNPSGRRHIVIVGRGREAVRTASIDVVEGGKNEVAPIRLTADCR